MVETILDECLFASPGLDKIEEGTDILPRKLAKHVGMDDIRFNSRVSDIYWAEDKVRVE